MEKDSCVFPLSAKRDPRKRDLLAYIRYKANDIGRSLY